MNQENREGQSAGVMITGTIGSVGRDIVGRDKIVGVPPKEALDAAFKPLLEVLAQAAPEARGAAARALQGIVKLVPEPRA